MVEIGRKNSFFWLILRGFLFISFYTIWVTSQDFGKWKTLLTFLLGKFHQYSICGCEVKNFRSFSCLFSIHKMAPFWDFLDPYSPKYCSTLLKFWPEVVSNGLFQKKNKQGEGWVHTFLKTPLEFLGFLLYPWKFQIKQSFTLRSSTKLYYTSPKIDCPKPRPLEIPHDFSYP